jgi:LysM repeat protein
MTNTWTRRKLILSGSAGILLAAGCGRQPQVGRTSTAPTNPRAGGIWYEVVDGDTLSSIARRSNTTVQTLVETNQLSSNILIPQTKLWIPGALYVGPDPLAHLSEPDRDTVPPPVAEPGDIHEPDLPPLPGSGYVLVGRSRWTNKPPSGNNRPIGKVTRITIHHTDEHGGLIGLPDVEVVKRIENYHRNGKKWCAIGYHYLVGKDGRVYEGRPNTLQGAHVLSENENNIGISTIGNWHKSLPSTRQLTALKAFIEDTRDRYHVGAKRIYGHRDLNQSICPGDALYAWLRAAYRA